MSSYSSLIDSLFNKSTGGASKTEIGELNKFLQNLAKATPKVDKKTVGTDTVAILNDDSDGDIVTLKEEIGNIALQQYIQMMYDTYMSTDIPFRLGEVTGTLKFRSDGKVDTSSIATGSFAQFDEYGNIDTTANLRLNIPLESFGNNSWKASDRYLNFFFPPYTNANISGSSSTFNSSKMIATVKELATFRTPAYKKINDNISLLQHIFEQTSGVVSTYLTDWDISLYLQESMIDSSEDNKSKIITLMNKILQDNPSGYRDSRACVYGQLGAAVSKYSPDQVAYNEKPWRPDAYPLSQNWTPYNDIKYGDNLDAAFTVARRGFESDHYEEFESGYTFDKFNTNDKIKYYDYIGAAYSGWKKGWNDLRNYQTLYTTPADGLEEIDIIHDNQTGKNTMSEAVTEICNKLAELDETVGYRQELWCNKVCGVNYNSKNCDCYDYYYRSPSTGKGIHILKVMVTRKGKRVKPVAFLDVNKDRWNGSESPEVIERFRAYATYFRPLNISKWWNIPRATANAGRVFWVLQTAEVYDNLEIPDRAPQKPYEAPVTTKKSTSSTGGDKLSLGGSGSFSNPSGISQLAPALYGGPHGCDKSPNTVQGYFEEGNSLLQSVPRIDTSNYFEGVNTNYGQFFEATGETPDTEFGYRYPGKIIKEMQLCGVKNDKLTWTAEKEKKCQLTVPLRILWVLSIPIPKIKISWLKIKIWIEWKHIWLRKSGTLSLSQVKNITGSTNVTRYNTPIESTPFEVDGEPPASGKVINIKFKYQPAPTTKPMRSAVLNAPWTLKEKTIYTYTPEYELALAQTNNGTGSVASITALSNSLISNGNIANILQCHTTSELKFNDSNNDFEFVVDIIREQKPNSCVQNTRWVEVCLVQTSPGFLLSKIPIRWHAKPYKVAVVKTRKFLWWHWNETVYEDRCDRYLEADVNFTESENKYKHRFVVSGIDSSWGKISNLTLNREGAPTYTPGSYVHVVSSPYQNTVTDMDAEESEEADNTTAVVNTVGIGYLPYFMVDSSAKNIPIKNLASYVGISDSNIANKVYGSMCTATMALPGAAEMNLVDNMAPYTLLFQTVIRQYDYIRHARTLFLENVDFQTLKNIITTNVDPAILKYSIGAKRNRESTHYRYFIDNIYNIVNAGKSPISSSWTATENSFKEVINMFTGKKSISSSYCGVNYNATCDYTNKQYKDLTVSEVMCLDSIVEKAKSLVNNKNLDKINNYMISYLHVLYEYRKYFIFERCNKQGGSLFYVRSFESAVPLLLNQQTETWVGGDGTNSGDGMGNQYSVYCFDKTNTNSDKYISYKESKNLSEDRIDSLYVKVKYVSTDEAGKDTIKEFLTRFRSNKYKLKSGDQNYAFNVNKGQWVVLPRDGRYDLHSAEWDKAYRKDANNQNLGSKWYDSNDKFVTVSKDIVWSGGITNTNISALKNAFPAIWNEYRNYTSTIPVLGTGLPSGNNDGKHSNGCGIYSVYDVMKTKGVCIYESGNIEISAQALMEVSASGSDMAPDSVICSSNTGNLDLWSIPLNTKPIVSNYKTKPYIKKQKEDMSVNSSATTTLSGVFSYSLYPITENQESMVAGLCAGLCDNLPKVGE